MMAAIAISFFLAVVFLTIGMRIEAEKRSPLARLRQRVEAGRELTPEEAELRRPFLVRFLGPFAEQVLVVVARFTPPALKDNVRRRLMVAGNPKRWHSEEVILSKAVFSVVGLIAAFWLAARVLRGDFRSAVLIALVGSAIGFLIPDVMISRWTRARKRHISVSLPFVLDLLCVSVEVGLSFEAAMQKVSEKVQGPLSEEFKQVAYEVRIGKPRREALRDMRDRCGVEDLNTFVAAVIQAERLGLGIAEVLRVQADQLRAIRRERAREQAMKVPVKMLFPLVFLILPALFVVILGPAFIQVMRTMTEGGGF